MIAFSMNSRKTKRALSYLIFKNSPRKPPMLPQSIAAHADFMLPFFQ